MSAHVGLVNGHYVTIEPDKNQRHWIALCTCHWQSLAGRSALEVRPRGQHHLDMITKDIA
jgi:hypothetical protein